MERKPYKELTPEEREALDKETLKAIAEEYSSLGLPPEDIEDAYKAASLHYEKIVRARDEAVYQRIFCDWIKLLVSNGLLIKTLTRALNEGHEANETAREANEIAREANEIAKEAQAQRDKVLEMINERDERDKAAALRKFLDELSFN